MNIFEIIGIIAWLSTAIPSIPQIIQTFKNKRCEMIIIFDVLDMGDMMSLLDNLWLVFRFSADAVFQFNHYDLFSDNASFDLEVFQKKEIITLLFQ